MVHYRISDEMMDSVMAIEGEAVDVPGVARAWQAKHLANDLLFFRVQPHTLGLAPRAVLTGMDPASVFARAAPDDSPPLLLLIRDPPFIPKDPAFVVHRARVAVESLDGARTRAGN
jgi:hypothetical protein